MIQKSPPWFEAKRGRITASEVGPFVTNQDATAKKARFNLLCKKLGELAGEDDIESFQNDAMKRGTAIEALAREEYAATIQRTVHEVGIITHDSLPLGCSPDGLIMIESWDGSLESATPADIAWGVEIKGPIPSTQIKYILAGCLPPEYKSQIHHSMILAGTPWWDFYSWSPRVTRWEKTREQWTVLDWEPGEIPPLYVRVMRDSYTEELEAGLKALCREYDDLREQVRQIALKYEA